MSCGCLADGMSHRSSLQNKSQHGQAALCLAHLTGMPEVQSSNTLGHPDFYSYPKPPKIFLTELNPPTEECDGKKVRKSWFKGAVKRLNIVDLMLLFLPMTSLLVP